MTMQSENQDALLTDDNALIKRKLLLALFQQTLPTELGEAIQAAILTLPTEQLLPNEETKVKSTAAVFTARSIAELDQRINSLASDGYRIVTVFCPMHDFIVVAQKDIKL